MHRQRFPEDRAAEGDGSYGSSRAGTKHITGRSRLRCSTASSRFDAARGQESAP
ncbi:hypothetical protein KNP414_05432 [Paenibacillus mucilaginosus KNP414]|uniref:Uncharacterized protein n=1 Tax=Paenibacillus mucilaginosus (strain KNP414) TaxID=1036673 RepID=F8FI53_PAEMK|nr:hypothetical protein KNP414_05432 [Paenibacillus mucilaginosus KNP414]